MRRLRGGRRTAAALLAALVATTGAAASDEPAVRLEWATPPGAAPARPAVGDRLPLHAVVTIPAGYQVEPPRALGDGTAAALLAGGPPRGEAAAGGGEVRTYPLELMALDLGPVGFQGVAVPWIAPDGRAGVAKSGPLELEVQAAVEDPMRAEPADIRGPAAVPIPFGLPPWSLALAAAALLALVWWLWRRRRSLVAGPEPWVDPFAGLGPADWALQQLEALVREEALKRKGVEAFHVRLAEIVRRYLEGQFRIHALERTSSEILLDVESRLRPGPATRLRLQQLLAACDMVKFARQRPADEQALELVGSASALVQETRPPEPAAAAEPAP